MKLSTGMIGTLLFTVVATAAFVWMVKRPAVDGNAMIFGMPAAAVMEKVEDKTPEEIIPASIPVVEVLEPKAEPESTQTEEITEVPVTSADEAAASEIEIKIEEMLETTPPESIVPVLEDKGTELITN